MYFLLFFFSIFFFFHGQLATFTSNTNQVRKVTARAADEIIVRLVYERTHKRSLRCWNGTALEHHCSETEINEQATEVDRKHSIRVGVDLFFAEFKKKKKTACKRSLFFYLFFIIFAVELFPYIIFATTNVSVRSSNAE